MPSRLRRTLAAFVAAAAALALTACGGTLSTVLTVADGTTGSRVMTATLSASDLGDLEGGSGAIDSSIRAHLPSALQYNGLSGTPDGGVTVTFTLPFSSASDYAGKVDDLLVAGGEDASTPQIAASDGDFISGISVNESFTSAELLQWMVQGLVSDGVLSSSDAGYAFEDGDDASVVYNGTTYPTSTEISVDQIEDRGFDSIAMTTTLGDDDEWVRQFAFDVSPDKLVANQSLYTGFFAALPSGLSATDNGGGSWRVTTSAESPDQIASDTNALLQASSGVFQVTEVNSTDDPIALSTTVTDFAECPTICSPYASPITDELVVPTSWSADDGSSTPTDDGTATTVDLDFDSAAAVVFSHRIPFQRIDVSTSIAYDGALTRSYAFVVAAADDALAGDGFTQVLTPAVGEGTIASTSGTDTTTYTVAFAAADPDTLNGETAYLDDGSLSVADRDGANAIIASYGVETTIDLSALAAGGVTDGIHESLRVPAWLLQHLDLADGAEAAPQIAFSTASWDLGSSQSSDSEAFTVSGLALGGLILFGALIIVVAALVVLTILFLRHRRRHPRAPRAALMAPVAPLALAAAAPIPAPAGPAALAPREASSASAASAGSAEIERPSTSLGELAPVDLAGSPASALFIPPPAALLAPPPAARSESAAVAPEAIAPTATSAPEPASEPMPEPVGAPAPDAAGLAPAPGPAAEPEPEPSPEPSDSAPADSEPADSASATTASPFAPPIEAAGPIGILPTAAAIPTAEAPVEAEADIDDEATIVAPRPAPKSPWALLLPDGQRVGVGGAGLVLGRKASAPPTHPGATACTIPDEGKTLSRSHTVFDIVDGELGATDLKSANGTTITRADGAVEQLAPGVRVVVAAGDVVELGDVKTTVVRSDAE